MVDLELAKQEKIWELDVYNRVFGFIPSGQPEWCGGNIDIGFGPGSPNISYSHDYITFYTCTNKVAEGINAKTIGSVEFYQRWIDILNPKYLKDDALFLLHKIPVIDGFLKKWGI